MYIKILILFLTTQSSYCAQNEFTNLEHVYYNDNFKLKHVFCVIKQPQYMLSDIGFRKIQKKIVGRFLRSFFYTDQTPYVFLNQQDVLWYLKKYDRYIPCNDQDDPCPVQSFKGIFFINPPHCGDLAYCIKQLKDFDEKDNLLKLLDASYDVQKVVRSQDEYLTKMCHFTHFRTQIMPLINEFRTKSFTQYTLQTYQNNVQEIFLQAVASYSVSITKNLILLLLIHYQNSSMLFIISCYGVIGIAVMVDLVKLGPSVDLCLNVSHLITAGFIIALYANILNNTMCYYQKILSMYWIAHASFFLSMLCYKYNNFTNVVTEYKNYNKIIALLNEERLRDKKIILL
jgi:hypothetical protein